MTFPLQGAADPADIADSVATATLSVPGVTRMHTGSFGEVATYLPGRRIEGVRLRDGATEVHVVLNSTASLMETAQTIRNAVAELVPGEVDVFIEDLSEDLARNITDITDIGEATVTTTPPASPASPQATLPVSPPVIPAATPTVTPSAPAVPPTATPPWTPPGTPTEPDRRP